MSHKKSSVVCSVPVPGPVCPCVCLWGGPFCCVCLYYPKASKPAFLSSLWPQKPRRCHAQPRLADVVVWVVAAVAVTSILATCRALGIFYKNNLTRFFARTTTMADGNHTLSLSLQTSVQNAAHIRLISTSCCPSLFAPPSPFCSHTLSPSLSIFLPAAESLKCWQYVAALLSLLSFKLSLNSHSPSLSFSVSPLLCLSVFFCALLLSST